VYFKGSDDQLFAYNISDNSWWQLPDGPFNCSGLAILNGQPTIIGGTPDYLSCTNKLMTLTTDSKWTEKFPPMPTKQMLVTAVSTGTILIIAGGVRENHKRLATVEVLNLDSSRWSTAVDLPTPLHGCSAAVHGDQLYMLGGSWDDKSLYTCSVSALLQICTQKSSLAIEERTSALSLSNSSSGVWSINSLIFQLGSQPV
jgi:N-acetylneuraminic acid mutarotase